MELSSRLSTDEVELEYVLKTTRGEAGDSRESLKRLAALALA
jgi:hypothetical protein